MIAQPHQHIYIYIYIYIYYLKTNTFYYRKQTMLIQTQMYIIEMKYVQHIY